MRRAAILAALCAALPGALTACGADGSAGEPPRLLVAVGDSSAVGSRPDANGRLRVTRVNYPQMVADRPGDGTAPLRLVQLGCGRHSAAAVVTGPTSCDPARGAPFRGGSALRHTELVLREQRERVAVVTVGVGLVDLEACARVTPTVDRACARRVTTAAARDADEIGRRIAAAAAPGTRLVFLPTFDLFLPTWRRGGRWRAYARGWAALVARYDRRMSAAFARHGFAVADVPGAFGMNGSLRRRDAVLDGERVPRPVARACRLTFICLPHPRSWPHPDRAGQEALAAAVRAALAAPR